VRVRFPIILALVVLAVCALTFAGPPKVSAQTLPPVAPTWTVAFIPWNAFVGVSNPGVNFAPAPGGPNPDSCWLYDSWCSYCTLWPSSDLCKAMPPSHVASSGAPSGGSH